MLLAAVHHYLADISSWPFSHIPFSTPLTVALFMSLSVVFCHIFCHNGAFDGFSLCNVPARLAEYQPLLEAVTDPATKLKTFVDCVQKAAAIAVPQKVCRKKETPWMNAELKTLIQERNQLRQDMGANRDAWVAKTREVL